MKQMLTEVVNCEQKLHCGPQMEVVSYATSPHLVKVKINFEAQKLMWKEIKCLYGLVQVITLIHISKLNLIMPFQPTLCPTNTQTPTKTTLSA